MDGDNNYVVGAGKLYFAPFDPVTRLAGPERYLGNTTAITRTVVIDKLDHYTSDYKLKTKDATADIQQDDTGAFTTDNVDLDNVALWFGGQKSVTAQAAAAAVTETFNNPVLGRWYQLGKTPENPFGVRKAGAITSIKVGATAMAAAASTAIDPDNYKVDLARARVFLNYEAEDIDPDTDVVMEIVYSLLVDSRTVIVSNGAQQEGELRYLADNRHGDNNDFFWPDAKLTANGDYALKGDTWAELQFNVEFLKKDEDTEVQYIMAGVGAS